MMANKPLEHTLTLVHKYRSIISLAKENYIYIYRCSKDFIEGSSNIFIQLALGFQSNTLQFLNCELTDWTTPSEHLSVFMLY